MRSPLAENIFRFQVAEAGLEDKYSADSAGTAAYHIGDAPDARMREVGENHGLIYSGKGRQINRDDFEKFDLIIPMDMSNYGNLKELATNANHLEKLHMMRDFDVQETNDRDVPDPSCRAYPVSALQCPFPQDQVGRQL